MQDNASASIGQVGYVSIEQPFGLQPPQVHCPICGQQQFVEQDDEYLETPCEHLAFVFGGEEDEFVYASADFSARFARFDAELDLRFPEEARAGEEYEEASSFYRDLFPRRLADLGYGAHLLALRITYGGMAEGSPVWFSDVYGFDYSTIRDEEA